MHKFAVGIRYLPLVSAVAILSFQFVPAQTIDPSSVAQVSVSSSLRQEFTLEPGVERHGTITLSNKGEVAAIVSITPEDIGFTPEGDTSRLAAGSLPTSNAAWIDSPAQVEVPARSTLDVPYTVRVPADLSASGSYWSMLNIQALEPQLLTEERPDRLVQTSIEMDFRYSVLVLTHVGAQGENLLQFTQPSFYSVEDGDFELSVGVHNAGRFVVEAATWVELYNRDGVLVKRVAGDSPRAYPGSLDRVAFDLGELEAEVYQAVVIADAGGNSIFGTRYNLDASEQ
ncbi:MAG: hypothetical protein WD273_08335 [Trueperaceae bacterium]